MLCSKLCIESDMLLSVLLLLSSAVVAEQCSLRCLALHCLTLSCPALPCSALPCSPCRVLLCPALPFSHTHFGRPCTRRGIHEGLDKQQGIQCVQGHLLGIQGTFLGPVAQVAIDLSHGCDPAVLKNADRILKELQLEEERFSATLGTGQKLLTDILQVSSLSYPLALPLHVS